MRLSPSNFIQILAATAAKQLVALPTLLSVEQSQQLPLLQQSTMSNQDQPHTLEQAAVLISDVMGRDRSMNVFAGFTRDVATVSYRLDSATQNSTVLAPLNSAIEKLPRKPWEDPNDYNTFGANAYDGSDGQDRAQRNLQRFVEAHMLPLSPWPENKKVKSLLDGDREIWWETKGDVKVIQPDGIEVKNIASKVGNGEVWLLQGTRNYA
ncbi:hypothetical protein F5Y15DRAFT_402762 [Xylariaceae sp. FL0016]|nr:hypothetical protein F5Y15DRAFT_402762 [Xylariaceae sp. FL0016]